MDTKQIYMEKAVKIVDSVYLKQEDIIFLDETSKVKALKSLLDGCFQKQEDELDKKIILDILLERESLGSTGIGDGLAMPHAKINGIHKCLVSLGISKVGVDFDSMDGKPAHIITLLLTPEGSISIYLKAMDGLCKIMKNPAFRSQLVRSKDNDEVIKLIDAVCGM